MNFKITHDTEYAFDSEVFLEPHYFRFRPKSTSYLTVGNYSLSTNVKAAGHKILRDEENNLIDFCWFEGLTEKLTISSISLIETTEYNPFNFILHPPLYNQLPFQYNERLKTLVSPAIEHQSLSDDLKQYGTELQTRSGNNTVQYLTQLTNQLHADFLVEYREQGEPLDPDETFRLKKGSCRDLSWMQIQLLRQQGFAARFVSGYFFFEMDIPEYELHAWVEVYLPGTGWLGLDPSHGILTGNSHFPIASSAHFENTMPVSGGIRGSASSILSTKLSIEKL